MAKPPEKQPASAEKRNPPELEDDAFAAEVARRVSSIVGRDQAAKVVAQVVSIERSERFQGPIAHPAHLREYEEILPGSAERIIKMAEENLEHSRAMQDKALSADIRDIQDGRKYGFFALLALILGAIICGMTGHEVLAGAFLGAGALGTIGVLVKGRNGNGE
ncbi:MAG: DUF2335 domain-containing protein [Alphaproteobacteria bacterium]|nr:DUF2335 domain-containing protein [Alphaproteobacteria bacterium]